MQVRVITSLCDSLSLTLLWRLAKDGVCYVNLQGNV